MNDRNASQYDIVVAGGGMIGTCLALALAPLDLRVAVVEAVQRGADRQPSFDDRSTALSRSTQRMFEAMGLWPEVVAASTPIRHIHVSERGRFGFSHIDAEEQQVEALGYVVINRVLGQVLQGHLERVTGLDWICPASIVDLGGSGESRSVVIEREGGREQLDCRLLIAADGASSRVRDLLGISAARTDYDQLAVIGNLLPEKSMQNTAYERFTDTGPLALLPIADNRAAFVWTLDTERGRAVLEFGDDEFTKQLHEAFGGRLGRFSKVGKRAAYPLALSKANAIVASRAALLGNAAHGLHPVAAQGFNLGMRDVATLCDCLYDAREDAMDAALSVDCGETAILQRYADWRRRDHGKLVNLTDGLIRLFADRRPPVATLRNLGMLGFDLIPGVRRAFARHTMGLAGKLPRLSRGVPLL